MGIERERVTLLCLWGHVATPLRAGFACGLSRCPLLIAILLPHALGSAFRVFRLGFSFQFSDSV